MATSSTTAGRGAVIVLAVLAGSLALFVALVEAALSQTVAEAAHDAGAALAAALACWSVVAAMEMYARLAAARRRMPWTAVWLRAVAAGLVALAAVAGPALVDLGVPVALVVLAGAWAALRPLLTI